VIDSDKPIDPNEKDDKTKRNVYLLSKKVSPKAPMQLDLIFEKIKGRDDLRHMPNEYARSSLFTANNRKVARKSMQGAKLFHFNDAITIMYTGIELRAVDDELIFLELISHAQTVPFGEPFVITLKTLIKSLAWPESGTSYGRLRLSLARMRSATIHSSNSKAYGTSGFYNLISGMTAVNDGAGEPTEYTLTLDPSLMLLFAGDNFSSHTWETYKFLSPVARRLTDHIRSHDSPYQLTLDRFLGMCGFSVEDDNAAQRRDRRRMVRNACIEVIESGLVSAAILDKKDFICVVRVPGLGRTTNLSMEGPKSLEAAP
jgi:hypothetical protein